MILPGSFPASIILLIITLLCWGTWANTWKSSHPKWRFELYYFDFAIGAFIAAILCAVSLGTFGWDGFSFIDDIRLAGKRQDLFAFLGGMVFNLGNMLLVGSMSITGMAVAFPTGIGVALAVGAMWSIFLGPSGNLMYRLGGAVVLILAAVFSTMAWRVFAKARLLEIIKTGTTKSTKKMVSSKGSVIAIIAGIFLGSFTPLIQLGRESEIGLGPYSLGFVVAAGIVVSTFIFNLFFMNLPIDGKPVEIVNYFRAKVKTHARGMLGGVIWYLGALASFVVTRADGASVVAPGLNYALVNGSVVVAAVFGAAYWKEFSAVDAKVSSQILLMILFLILGVALLSASLIFAPK